MIFLSLVPRRSRPRKTVEDFMRLPEGVRAELIDGELFMSPSPQRPHQWVLGRLFNHLSQFVEEHRLGEVYVAPLDVYLPTGDVVEPDILFVSEANLEIVQDWIRGVPDLVVEILSPEGVARDRLIKRELYARNGVQEYWIGDTEEKTIEVFALEGKSFEPCGYFVMGEELSSRVIPGLRIPLARVFDF